jgi:hypothetical protein
VILEPSTLTLLPDQGDDVGLLAVPLEVTPHRLTHTLSRLERGVRQDDLIHRREEPLVAGGRDLAEDLFLGVEELAFRYGFFARSSESSRFSNASALPTSFALASRCF